MYITNKTEEAVNLRKNKSHIVRKGREKMIHFNLLQLHYKLHYIIIMLYDYIILYFDYT